MKNLAIASTIALTLTMGIATFSTVANAASSSKFVTTITTQTTPMKVNVVLGDDLAYRADHVSKNRRDRNGITSYRNGWSGQGKYGQRELDRLTKRMKKKMVAQLEKNGIAINDTSSNVLNIVITDARPNRPTFKQLSEPGLSYQSFALGGAKFEGNLTTGGQEAGTLSYAWYEFDIRDSSYGATWTDANRAIDRFARKTANALK